MQKFLAVYAFANSGQWPEIMINVDHIVIVQPVVKEVAYANDKDEPPRGSLNLCRIMLSYALPNAPKNDPAGGALEVYAACEYGRLLGVLNGFIKGDDAVFYMPPSEVMAAQTAVEASTDDLADEPPVGTA